MGAGNDTLVRNVQNQDIATTDAYNGGEGTDTLKVTTGANISSTNLAQYSSFETLDLTDAAGAATVNLAGVTMFTKLVNSDSTTGATVISGAPANLAVAITVANNNNESTTLTLATNTTTDAITVSVGGTAAVTMGTLTLANHETVTLNSITSASNSVGQLTTAAAKTLNITGDKQLTVTAGTAGVLKTIDASAMTGKFIMGASFGASAQTLTGGSAADTLFGTAGNDTIAGGAGADTINAAAAGNDTITGGTGNDKITIAAFANLTSADSIDGGEGTDSLIFSENANHDFTASTTTLSGVSNVEKLTFTGLDNKIVTINDTVMTANAVTVEIGAAAVGLGNNVTATYLDTWSAAHHSAPLGCHVPDLNQPTNMLVKSASLYDQKISHDPRVFVRTKCTNNKPCLCFEASDCPHTNGLIENPFPCLCRSMGWSDGAAVFDGTINNNTYYQPSLGCSPSKGGYCNGPQQRCTHFPIPTLDERMPLSSSFYVFNTVVLSCLLLFASYYLIDLSRAALQR